MLSKDGILSSLVMEGDWSVVRLVPLSQKYSWCSSELWHLHLPLVSSCYIHSLYCAIELDTSHDRCHAVFVALCFRPHVCGSYHTAHRYRVVLWFEVEHAHVVVY